VPLRHTIASSAQATQHSLNGWTPPSDAIFASPLARKRTPGWQYRLVAPGDYAPSLRSPWRAAAARILDLEVQIAGSKLQAANIAL
jgi:hypothetical protein